MYTLKGMGPPFEPENREEELEWAHGAANWLGDIFGAEAFVVVEQDGHVGIKPINHRNNLEAQQYWDSLKKDGKLPEFYDCGPTLVYAFDYK